jgi:hypothetical protein
MRASSDAVPPGMVIERTYLAARHNARPLAQRLKRISGIGRSCRIRWPVATVAIRATDSGLARRVWLPNRWAYCAGVYLGTRIAVVAGAALALVFHRPHFHSLAALGGRVPPSPSVVQRLAERSDGFWYTYIAQHGYGHTLHPLPVLAGMHERFSPWAFYPAWPLLIRGFHALAPSSYQLDALVLAGLVGFAALCAFYALARSYFDDSTARTATLLLAVWPASGVLNLPYSEGLFIAAAAVALLALHRQRWWIAGVAGAVATATRPTGLAVIVAALIAAGLEFRRAVHRPIAGRIRSRRVRVLRLARNRRPADLAAFRSVVAPTAQP